MCGPLVCAYAQTNPKRASILTWTHFFLEGLSVTSVLEDAFRLPATQCSSVGQLHYMHYMENLGSQSGWRLPNTLQGKETTDSVPCLETPLSLNKDHH